jgi:hypothetical protein
MTASLISASICPLVLFIAIRFLRAA